MDREQIEKWAREACALQMKGAFAGTPIMVFMPEELERFARLVWNAALAEAKEAVRPKSPRPCMCDRCTCGNQSDAEACAAWDATKQSEIAIDALAAKEPQP